MVWGYFQQGPDYHAGPEPRPALGSVYSLSLGYLGNGSVSSATDSVNGYSTLSYDNLNRLSTMSSPSNPSGCYGLSWTYDSVGNRTAQSVTSGTCSTFSASVNSNNQLTGGSYTYDAAGNMTNDGLNGYSYDAAGHILSVNGGSSATYVYDAFGRRIEDTGAGLVYLYDQAGRRISSVTTTGADDAHEVYAGSRLLAVHGYAAGFGKVTWVYHSDQLGTDRLITYLGSVAETCTSLPYGDGQSCATQGFGNPPARFAGYFPEAASGLDYASARSYSPSLGRFMSPDPVGGGVSNPQSLDKYTYVHGSPACHTDVSGLFCLEVAPNADGIDAEGAATGGDFQSGDSAEGYGYYDEGNPDPAGTVPGSNGGCSGSGGSVGSNPCDEANPTNRKVLNFIRTRLTAASMLAGEIQVPPENVLGLSGEESNYGTSPVALNAHNFFGLKAGFKESVGTYEGFSMFPAGTDGGFTSSGQAFVRKYGTAVDAIADPKHFTQALVTAGFNKEPWFPTLLPGSIRAIKDRLKCPQVQH